MAAQIKYHQKSKLLLAKIQTVDEATPVTPEGSDAIAIFDADFQPELESETFQYTGSELDDDEGVTMKDRYATASGDTFVPALGTISNGSAATVAGFALGKLFQAAGANVVAGSGTGAAPGNLTDQSIVIDKTATTNTTLTLDMLEESSADLTNQNLYRLYGVRANVDLDIEVGSRARLKWNFKGNSYDSLVGHESDFPMVQNPKIVPNYGTQKDIIMDAVRQSTITRAELQLYGTPFANSNNISFSKLSAPNLLGWEYGRFLSALEEGFDKGATGTDVVLTVLTAKADSTFVAEKMLEKVYHFQFAWGLTKGKRVKLVFDKLQCMGISNATVGNYKAKNITFRRTGNVELTMS